jgi:hypothetical protein
MNNRERENKSDSCHIAIALLRKKDNDRRNRELCFRQIIRDEESDIRILKERVKNIPGNWRIYKTVNKRLYSPALILMMKQLVDYREAKKFEYRLDSLWKNCLLQKQCKGERNFMIDVDLIWSKKEVEKFISDKELIAEELIKTPSGGWHIICKELDTRKLQGMEGIEVKRDDIKFLEQFQIKLSNEEYFNRVIRLESEYEKLSLDDFEEQYIKQKHKNLIDERDMCLDQIKESLNKLVLGNNSMTEINLKEMIEKLEQIK